MKVPTGWLIALALLATPVFAEEAKPKAESAPAAVEGGDSETDGSLAATMDDLEKFFKKQPLKFYGHFKLDMAYDSARTNDGNTAMWVQKQPDGDDNEFNMTARHSRLGLNWTAPPSWGPKAFGKIEIDFYGGGPENKENLRLRHAYMDFQWESGFGLLAGQTWDVFLPLWQWKLNTAVGWNQGNAAFRRPQLRGTYKGKMGSSDHWKIALAIADPIAKDIDGVGDDDGEDAGVPDFQGRLSFLFRIFENVPRADIGIGGIYGKREADLDGHDDDYTAWLFGIDLMIPLGSGVSVLAEFYDSQAASSYNASLALDYNKTLMREIRARGGFVNVKWKIDKFWMVVAGYGICDPRNKDLSDGQRSWNSSGFINVRYWITKWATVGLEYDRMQTDYLGEDDYCNNRLQMSFKLKF